MPPRIALACVTMLILGILISDSRNRRVSLALWIPLIWVGLLASRPFSRWLNPIDLSLSGGAEEGSPLDRNILSVLIAAAAFVLFTRRLRLTQWIKHNPWLFVFFFYCGISILWSDFPAIALKRWIRAVGALLMILVVLSEEDPVEALAMLIRRCAYILIPLSVLVIKYYREQGVVYDAWTGAELLVGVTTDKNALGRLCLVCGLFVMWEIITSKHNSHIHQDRLNKAIRFIMLATTLWLLKLADSATSLVGIVIGAAIIVALGLSPIRKSSRFLGTLAVLGVATAITFTMSFGLAERVAAGLGRNLTLTDRTFIWADLLNMQTNPVIGVGYDSFWLGERLMRFVETRHVTTSHNGYLEMYLELGTVGLCLFAALLLSVFQKAKRSMEVSLAYGRLRLAILTVFLLYNITESGYKVTTFICFVLMLVAIEFPAKVRATLTAAAVPGSAPRLQPVSRPNIRPVGAVTGNRRGKLALPLRARRAATRKP